MVLLWIRVGIECCDGIRIPYMEGTWRGGCVRESIREETIKRCVCDGEIHTWMKQTSVKIIK